MSKKRDSSFQGDRFASHSPQGVGSNHESDPWQAMLEQVAARFNRQYRGEAFELPTEVEAMPIFREWAAGTLPAKIASLSGKLLHPKRTSAV